MTKKKIVAISGGAGRIGTAFSKAIVKNGGKVLIGDINENKGMELVKDLGNDRDEFIKTDFTKQSQIVNFIESGIARFKKITAAVHCSYPKSSQWGTKFEDLDPKMLSQDLYNQLGSAIIFSKIFLKYFLKNEGGNLIHISSIQGISAPKFEHYIDTDMVSLIEYSAIKSGIISISRYLAKYYKHSNIRSNCISPGGILDNQPDEFLLNYNSECSSKGMLDSEDLCGSLLFLLSEESKYINGQNIIIDDGWSL